MRLDPRTETSEGELEEHLQFALEVRDAVSRLSGDVNRLRAVRKQLADRDDLLKDEARAADLVKGSKALIDKLDALEEKFHNPKAQRRLRHPGAEGRGAALLAAGVCCTSSPTTATAR